MEEKQQQQQQQQQLSSTCRQYTFIYFITSLHEIIHIVLTTWVRVWYGEIFHEHANLFHEPKASENKAWEWNILPYHSDECNK